MIEQVKQWGPEERQFVRGNVDRAHSVLTLAEGALKARVKFEREIVQPPHSPPGMVATLVEILAAVSLANDELEEAITDLREEGDLAWLHKRGWEV